MRIVETAAKRVGDDNNSWNKNGETWKHAHECNEWKSFWLNETERGLFVLEIHREEKRERDAVLKT